MAIMKKAVLATSLLASLAFAAPLNPRDMAVKTFTETDWTTIDVTTTIYVDEDGHTVEPDMPWATPAVATSSTSSSVEAAMTPSAYGPPVPPPSQSSPPPPAPPASSPTPPAAPASAASTPEASPSVSPAGFAQQSAAYTAPPAPPAPTTMVTSTAPAAAPYSSPAPAAPAPAPAAPAPAPAPAPAAGSSGGSTTGTCEGQGNACMGDVTHWDGGLGACGWNVNTGSDMEIALPFAFMGTQSNGNPYCGRSLTILNPTSGKTVQATVGDKCMGCTDRSIDLTDALFNAIVPNGDGRVHGIEWWLN